MDKVLAYFPFLKSTRFWAVVSIAFAYLLDDYNLISSQLSAFVLTVAGGHIGLRSLDRFAEKAGSKDTK
jgi:hypothetical protein